MDVDQPEKELAELILELREVLLAMTDEEAKAMEEFNRRIREGTQERIFVAEKRIEFCRT
jgi:hypothetical protein